MHSKRRRVASITLASLLLVSCAAGDKEQFGTLAGAVVGGVIGNKMGGSEGALAGVLIGGLIGNRIGAHLDEEDRKKLAELERRALDTGQGGSFITNKTKAKVSVSASPATFETRKPFVLSEALTVYPIMLVDTLAFNTFVDTPLYISLDEKQKPRMVIQKGMTVTVAANVINKGWAVIGDGNVGVGYVPLRYLKESIAKDPTRYNAPTRVAASAKTPEAKSKGATVAKKPPANATAVVSLTNQKEYDQEVSRLKSAYPDQPKTQSASALKEQPALPQTLPAVATAANMPKIIQASTECKVIVREVDVAGASELTESIKFCKEPPKGWQTQPT